jgi:hypothetical protein
MTMSAGVAIFVLLWGSTKITSSSLRVALQVPSSNEKLTNEIYHFLMPKSMVNGIINLINSQHIITF